VIIGIHWEKGIGKKKNFLVMSGEQNPVIALLEELRLKEAQIDASFQGLLQLPSDTERAQIEAQIAQRRQERDEMARSLRGLIGDQARTLDERAKDVSASGAQIGLMARDALGEGTQRRVKRKLDSQDDAIDELRANIDYLATVRDGLLARIDGLQREQEARQASVGDVEQQLGELRGERDRMSAQLAQAAQQSATQSTQFNALIRDREARLDDLEARVRDRSDLLVDLQAAVAQSIAELSDANTKLTRLGDDVQRDGEALVGTIGADFDAGVHVNALMRNSATTAYFESEWASRAQTAKGQQEATAYGQRLQRLRERLDAKPDKNDLDRLALRNLESDIQALTRVVQAVQRNGREE
jgi:chromosome segregation ATPase